MGRATYNFFPRPYLIWPLHYTRAPTLGATVPGQRNVMPLHMLNAGAGGSAHATLGAAFAPALPPLVLGAVWGHGAITHVTGPTMNAQSTGTSNDRLLADLAFPDTANNVGSITLGYADEAGPPALLVADGDDTAIASKNPPYNANNQNGARWLIRLAQATGDQVNDLRFALVTAPVGYGAIQDTAGSPVVEIPHNGSHTLGPSIGGLTTFLIPDINTTTSLVNSDVRRWVVPMGMRVHKVCFFCGGAGASADVLLRNETTSVNLTAATALVALGAVNVEVADLSNRNLAQGDILNLRVNTAATGYTAVGALVTCHITEHFRPNGDRLVLAANAANGLLKHRHLLNGQSGPVAGGLAAIPFGFGDLASAQVETTLSEVIAPFDCIALAGQFISASSGASNTLKILNATQAVDVTNEPEVDVRAPLTISNASIARGDVLQLRADTDAAAGFTDASAVLLVQPTGFPHDDAKLD